MPTSPADTFAYESLASSFVGSFGGAGSGAGQLNSPRGVAVDTLGNVWVTDRGNNRVDEFSATGEFELAFGWGVRDGAEQLETCTESCRAGLTGSGPGEFGGPNLYNEALGGIAIEGADVWVADAANSRVEEFTTSGEYVTQITTRWSPDSTDDRLGGQSVGAFLRLWHRAGVLDGERRTAQTVLEHLRGPCWPGARLAGQRVGDHENGDRVEEFSPEGTFMLTFGRGVKDGEAKLETCTAECKAGISGSGNGEFSNPVAVTADAMNTLWVVDYGNNRVQRFTLSGEYLTQFGSAGGGPGQLAGPGGVAVTNGSLYVADTGNNRIEHWEPQPPIVTGVQPTTGSEAGGIDGDDPWLRPFRRACREVWRTARRARSLSSPKTKSPPPRQRAKAQWT